MTSIFKMNGAGNDFIIFDARADESFSLSREKVRSIADRNNKRTGGCDQVIVMLKPKSGPADVFMKIFNSDGESVGMCGNATRCVAWKVMGNTKTEAVVQTLKRSLACKKAGDLISVDMGEPEFDAASIPMNKHVDRKRVPIAYGELKDGVAVGMGNPHIVFFVNDVDAVDVKTHGKKIENDHTDIFPHKVNVSFAQVIDKRHIRLRTWERGAGATQACGTAACATGVAAMEQKLTERQVDIQMPGGLLVIEWRKDNHVWMTGPIAFEGPIKL